MIRKAEFKQMSFDTAIRNPERYLGILRCIAEYNGQILNDENLLKIVSKLYVEKEVTSNSIIIDKNSTIDKISEKVKEVNSTRKADGGYPEGYQSRFWTYVRTLSELGLVYAQYNQKFILSDITVELLKGNIDEQEVFLIQMLRTNRKSPYRNVLNDYNYFRFIIKVLIELKKINKKLSYNEFVLSTFCRNDNVKDFLKLLKKEKDILKNNRKTYEYIKDNFPKVNIENTVMKDYPDVVLRLLRITGLITITSHVNAIYLEINSSRLNSYYDLINYGFNLSDEEKNNKILYFNKIGTFKEDLKNILKLHREKEDKIVEDYNVLIKNTIEKYNLSENYIIDHLERIESTRIKEIPAFKYIPLPVRFEFFTSILIYFLFGDEYKIRPNYKMDSNGLPTSHAPSKKGDIEVYSDKTYWILEVSLIRNRTQQYNNETTNLIRHFNNKKEFEKYFLSFIAPYVHEDTQRLFNALIITLKIEENIRNVNARTYKLEEFLKIIKKKDVFIDMEDYTKEYTKKLKEKLQISNI